MNVTVRLYSEIRPTNAMHADREDCAALALGVSRSVTAAVVEIWNTMKMSGKRKIVALIVTLVVVIGGYTIFMMGRYSYLIVEPELFLSRREKAVVEKARNYALTQGIPAAELKKPKVLNLTRVYFGGMNAFRGVEVTVLDQSGDVIEMSY